MEDQIVSAEYTVVEIADREIAKLDALLAQWHSVRTQALAMVVDGAMAAEEETQAVDTANGQTPELPLCACNCGERVMKPKNKYISGHHLKGVNKQS